MIVLPSNMEVIHEKIFIYINANWDSRIADDSQRRAALDEKGIRKNRPNIRSGPDKNNGIRENNNGHGNNYNRAREYDKDTGR